MSFSSKRKADKTKILSAFLRWFYNRRLLLQSFLDEEQRKSDEELRKVVRHVIDDYHKTRFGIENALLFVIGRLTEISH